MQRWFKSITMATLLIAVIAGFYFSLQDKPILVDVGVVSRQPMSVTIDEEGIARVKDVYSLSAPIAGYLSRTTLDEGDPIAAQTTVVASIHPLDPPFIDDRTRRELEATVEAARSAVELAKVERERVTAALTLARSEYARAAKLKKTNTISESAIERSYSELKLQEAQLGSSDATIRLRQAQLSSAKARLTPVQGTQTGTLDPDCCVDIVSPVGGVVLTMYTRSEQALSAGTLIADVGNPSNIEVIVDLLSSDAVKIKPGASAEISQWGGDKIIQATVQRINPAAFTKVSALGIEEQRVNVVLSLNEAAPGLGHGFRVFVRLTVWASPDVLQLPMGAIFRLGGQWAVFIVEDGIAKSKPIQLGKMNNHSAQVIDGLSPDNTIILYPNDLIDSGTRVAVRPFINSHN